MTTLKGIKAQRYYLIKCIIKNYNVIKKNVIDEKNFYDQSIDSTGVKQYKEIRKLTTGQGKDFTTGCLLAANKFCRIT